MSFLAMTAGQALLLGFGTAAVIVALYFLKLRRRRMVVPSSILWQRVLADRQARSIWQRLQRLISILIAVTIGLLLALALARPDIPLLNGKHERVVVVLDTSPTMATKTADGKSRWEHGVERATALIENGGARTEYRIAGTSGLVDTPFSADRKELRESLARMHPQAAEPRFPGVEGDARIVFISDGVVPLEVPESSGRISVFEAAENVGITAFEVRAVPATPSEFEGYLEVQNRGKKAAAVDVSVNGAGGRRIERHATLKAGDAMREVLDLSGFDGGALEARVQSAGDAFALDNTAFAYLPIKRKTRTLLVTSGNSFLETALKLNAHVAGTVVKPAEYKPSADYDAYIFDRFAPATPPPAPSLVVGAPAADWLPKSKGVAEKPAIGNTIEDHPVLRHVALHDVSVQRAQRIDASRMTVLAGTSDVPLLVSSEPPTDVSADSAPPASQARWVLLTFELGGTDFPYQAGFPIFIENVLAWFSREQVALRRSPGTVSLPLAGAEIRTLDGKSVPSHSQLNETVFEVDAPGLYVANAGDTRLHIAVNLANPTISNVNASFLKEAEVSVPPRPLLRNEVWFYLVLAALVLIALEWFTYHRQITL